MSIVFVIIWLVFYAVIKILNSLVILVLYLLKDNKEKNIDVFYV